MALEKYTIEMEMKNREEKGYEEGFEEVKIEVAKNALLEGWSIDIIKKATGLSDREIEEIKSKLN